MLQYSTSMYYLRVRKNIRKKRYIFSSFFPFKGSYTTYDSSLRLASVTFSCVHASFLSHSLISIFNRQPPHLSMMSVCGMMTPFWQSHAKSTFALLPQTSCSSTPPCAPRKNTTDLSREAGIQRTSVHRDAFKKEERALPKGESGDKS